MKPKVLLTRQIPEEGLALLREFAEVEILREKIPPGSPDLKRALRDKDALLCLLTDKVGAEILSAAPNLKIIANMAVGYDNIDIEEASRRGIMVTHTPGVLTETTADLTWALLLGLARRIPEADAFVREGRFAGWSPLLLLGTDVHGKTLGIVGAGRIGSSVARRAAGFRMRVLYHDRSRKEDLEKETGADAASLEDLLRASDFVSLHLPLTDETFHRIGEGEIRLMKRTAYLVNTSRGPVVDEEALLGALEEGRIAGAALDVFEGEPEVPERLRRLSRVVLSPHIGSASRETRGKMAGMAAECIRAWATGEEPEHRVDSGR